MQLIYDPNRAKKLARSLEKFFASKGIELVRGQALDAVAAMQGFPDWNALAAQIHPSVILSELCEFEREHMRESRGQEYGREGELKAHTGFALRYPLESEGCEYVRAVDPLGREIAFWHREEWQRDPGLVMGAVLGAVVRGQSESSTPQTPHQEIVLRSPLTMYGEAVSSDSEWSEVPPWYKLVITQEWLDELLRLRELVIQSKVHTVSKYEGPDLWGRENHPEDPIRLDNMGSLVISDSYFYYEAWLKHQDAKAETGVIDFEPFLEAIAGQSEQKAWHFERRGDVVIWGKNADAVVDMLREDGEDIAWSKKRSGESL